MEGGGGRAPRPAKSEGARLQSLEEEARIADERLRRLEAGAALMKGDVERLAEATGGLRQQSAKMREAALRVAEVVEVAAKRKAVARKKAGQRRAEGAGSGAKPGQGEGRPPRT